MQLLFCGKVRQKSAPVSPKAENSAIEWFPIIWETNNSGTKVKLKILLYKISSFCLFHMHIKIITRDAYIALLPDSTPSKEGLVTFARFLGYVHHYVIVFQMVLRNHMEFVHGIANAAGIQARIPAIWLVGAKTRLLTQYNQENIQLSPDTLFHERVGSRDKTSASTSLDFYNTLTF